MSEVRESPSPSPELVRSFNYKSLKVEADNLEKATFVDFDPIVLRQNNATVPADALTQASGVISVSCASTLWRKSNCTRLAESTRRISTIRQYERAIPTTRTPTIASRSVSDRRAMQELRQQRGVTISHISKQPRTWRHRLESCLMNMTKERRSGFWTAVAIQCIPGIQTV